MLFAGRPVDRSAVRRAVVIESHGTYRGSFLTNFRGLSFKYGRPVYPKSRRRRAAVDSTNCLSKVRAIFPLSNPYDADGEIPAPITRGCTLLLRLHKDVVRIQNERTTRARARPVVSILRHKVAAHVTRIVRTCANKYISFVSI